MVWGAGLPFAYAASTTRDEGASMAFATSGSFGSSTTASHAPDANT